ncbi:MAG TPA: glycosyltransferase 87 family protein [Eudoraea sp.]|nr:glycosyltransferase 87 family protein [Eudoraea sp.]
MTLTNILQILTKHRWLPYVFFGLLLLLNLSYGYYRLMYLNSGGDSQWYGTKLLWEGTDPFTAALQSPEWFMTAYPNYAHILYYVLYPLSFFEWEQYKIIWFLVNIACFLFTLYAFVRWEKVPRSNVLILASVMLLGSTFTNTLYQGQISILIFCWASLAWIFRNHSGLLLIFLSLIISKYSFGLPIILGFFLAGYYRESIGAFAVNVGFALVFALKFDLSLLDSLRLPFEVASQFTSGHGHSDLLTIYRLHHGQESFFGFNYFSVGAALLYALFALYCLVYNPGRRRIIIATLILSFPILFHLTYDYVVLLAPMLIACSPRGLSKKYILILAAFSAYFWIYPMIPKFLRIVFDVDIGIHPIDYFGNLYGKVFIILNLTLFIIVAFAILQEKASNKTAVNYNNGKGE